MSVPIAKNPTHRYDISVDVIDRASSADKPIEIAQTAPMSSAATPYSAATRTIPAPPSATAQNVNGSDSASATSPTAQPERSLPIAISPGRSMVTCRVASVPRSRSPLMVCDVKAGLMINTMPSTKNMSAPKSGTPRLRGSLTTYWLENRLSKPSVTTKSSSTQAPSNQRHRP